MKKLCSLLLSFLFLSNCYAWNSLGHRLIAQVAYDQLTPQAKNLVNNYNHALDAFYGKRSFVTAAPWLDSLRSPQDIELQGYHYINIPFSDDNTRLIPPNKVNAVYAIRKAVAVLQNPRASAYDKGFYLRILIHVVGDLHQPLHAASQYSRRLPGGDKGGNLFYLAPNPVAKNLHSYWDNGGGWLKPRQKRTSMATLARKARTLLQQWPCAKVDCSYQPEKWAEASHRIAVEDAYLIKRGQKPSKSYQYRVKQLSQQQISIAGCRLASILNDLTDR